VREYVEPRPNQYAPVSFRMVRSVMLVEGSARSAQERFVGGLEIVPIVVVSLSVVPMVGNHFGVKVFPRRAPVIQTAPLTQEQNRMIATPRTLVRRRNQESFHWAHVT
jgi:hypothetical protein